MGCAPGGMGDRADAAAAIMAMAWLVWEWVVGEGEAAGSTGCIVGLMIMDVVHSGWVAAVSCTGRRQPRG